MAATSAARSLESTLRKPAGWHRYRITLAAVAGAGVVLLLTLYGMDYYTLERAQQLLSPKHSQLRSSGSIGYALGTVAAGMFVLIFLYPLRKRWPWLARKGKTKHWLDFHILLGLVAPAIITFHSAFRLHGVAGVAYWIMMSVVLSGVVGRYFYAQIPRRLDAAEMSLQEMQVLSDQLSAALQSQAVLTAEQMAPLLRLPVISDVRSLPLPRVLALMLALDLRRPFLLWRIGRETRAAGRDSRELEEVIATVRGQAALAKKILFLSQAQRIFHLWHIVHRPFSYSFAILAALHVLIVLLLGFY